MLHISDLNRYTRCKKLFYLSRKDKSKALNFSFFNFEVPPEESIRQKLGIKEYFRGTVGDPSEKALAAMDQYEWLISARFQYQDLRIKVPYFHHTDKGWDLYFCSYTPIPTVELANSYSLCVEVLKKLGIEVNNIYLIRFNMDYVRGKELDYNQLWIVSDKFCSAKGNPSLSIDLTVKQRTKDLNQLLKNIEEFDPEDIVPEKNTNCTRRNKCVYFDVCFPEHTKAPDNSILLLNGCAHKEEMYAKGIRRMKDADLELVEGNKIQYAQIMADRENGLFVDKLALKRWYSLIESEPAIFLDFEWDVYAVPPYEGMKPLSVLPFQYSMHILNQGKITHKEYLGQDDCRKAFIEHLLKDLPKKGKIYAYNALGAEMLRIKELAEQFPEYKKPLMKINARMVDLSLPFESGMIYDLKMRGYYSLKTLSKIVDHKHSYKELDVSHGLEAIIAHRRYARTTEVEPKRKLRAELLEYCAMDTRELMKVYLWLGKKSQE